MIQRVGLVGFGEMGVGIATVCIEAGLEVYVYDAKSQAFVRGGKYIHKYFDKKVEKGILSEAEKEEIIDRILTVGKLEELKDCDFIIEAATEKKEIKLQIFEELDEICAPNVVLASNTSTISIGSIAQAAKRHPERVIGLHFMKPPFLIKFLEIITHKKLPAQTLQKTLQLVDMINFKNEKTGDLNLVITSDQPGFLVNFVLFAQINAALWKLKMGESAKDVDKAFVSGTNVSGNKGPLHTLWWIGLDTGLYILESIRDQLRFDNHPFAQTYEPCPLLKKLVKVGRLGHKTGDDPYEMWNI